MDNICFTENQRFRELAFFVLIWVLQIIFFLLLTKQIFFPDIFSKYREDFTTLILINILFLAINLFLYSINLKTKIDDKGISVRYIPVQFRSKCYMWSEIEDVSLVKYDGTRDYLGYGLRYSQKNGWCYTVSGTDGLRIKLKTGRKILIGTHDRESLETVLQKLTQQGTMSNT
jgi:hypothetical protein